MSTSLVTFKKGAPDDGDPLCTLIKINLQFLIPSLH